MAVGGAEIFRVFGSVLLKDKEANEGLDKLDNKASGVGATFGKLAKGVVAAGAVIGTTLIAVGVKATKTAADFEKGMANVATLLDGDFKPRIAELSKEVTGLMTNTGLSAEVLQDGLYQVISAFGDTADSMDILKIASQGAVAGNASVTDAVNLLSAITKGYGDTSAEANKKASDLAFTTVKLGQTTFPELAQAMGKVIPMASALNISQEELFGVFATLTGVTGSASEVTTQFRGILQGMMKPSEEMAYAIHELGYESGTAMLETLGLNGTLQELMKSVDGNAISMSKLFPSIESAPAVLALVGGQADVFIEKTNAMSESIGMTEEAFSRQQDTFASSLARAKETLNVMMIEIGTKLLPIVNNLLQEVMKFLPIIMDLVEPLMQKLIPVLGQLIEKLLPVIAKLFESLVPILEPIIDLFFALVDEVLLPLVDLLVPLIDMIMPVFISLFKELLPVLIPIIKALMGLIERVLPPFVEILLKLIELVLPIFVKVIESLTPIIEMLADTLGDYLLEMFEALMPVILEMAEYLEELMPLIQVLADLLIMILVPVMETMMPIMIEIIQLLSKGLIVYFKVMATVVNAVVKAFKWLMTTTPQEVFDNLVESLKSAWEWLKNIGKSIFDFYKNIWTSIKDFFVNGATNSWNSIKKFFTDAFNSVVDFFRELPKRIGEAIDNLARTARIKFLLFKLKTKSQISELIEDIITFFKELPTRMWNAFDSMVDWFLGMVAGYINKVITLWFTLPKQIVDSVVEMFNNVVAFFVNGFNMIVESITQFVEDSKQRFWDMIDAIVAAFNWVVEKITEFKDDSIQRFKDMVDWIVQKFEDMVTWFKELPQKIINAITSLAEKIKTFVVTVFTNFKNASIERLNNLITWFKELPDKVITAVGSLHAKIFNFGKTIIDKLKSGLEEKWNGFIIFIKSLPQKIVDAMGTIHGKIFSFGKDIVTGIWNGINNMVDWLKEKLVNFAKKAIPDPIAKALGIASPSKVFMGFGKNISQGLAEGIDDAKKLVEDASFRLSIAAQAGAKLTPEFATTPTTNNYYSANRRIEVPLVVNGREIAREFIDDIDEGLQDLTVRRRN